jgi:plastocyanin
MKLEVLMSEATKIGFGEVLVAALCLMTSYATAAPPNRASVSAYEVPVQVKLLDAKSGETLKDFGGIVVWLTPVHPLHAARLNVDLLHYRIMQHNKGFNPYLLVVPVGSTVEFRNSDPWYHSAFSLFGRVRFDLGSQRPGVGKKVRFGRAGVVYVFCNLHPQMEAVILTVDSPYFGVSDKTGQVSIRNVPPGRYNLHAWYESAASQALKPLHHAILLRDGRRGIPRISIALVKKVPIIGENRELGGAVPVKESNRSSHISEISPARSCPRHRTYSNLLYGVTAGDPVTFVAVSAVLSGMAILACYIRARRAASIDPKQALRTE